MPARRTLYSLHMLFRHRRSLGALRRQGAARTLDICAADLKSRGISVLVLDFDGVLASHGERQPLPETAAWLQECIAVFGPQQVFILSNKPLPERLAYFARACPGVRCITGVRKKPYPDGLREIARLSGAAPGTVLLVDDRLLTGGLAACIAGMQATYVGRPYVNLKKRLGAELFFMALRGLERLAVTLLGGGTKKHEDS